MKLNENGLKNRNEWEEKGYEVPKYDRQEMIKRTKENPCWVHFGAGNIFRAFHADIAEKLLNEGITDKGITVVEGYDYEIIEKKYHPNDYYSITVVLKSDGSVDKKVVGSVGESLILDSNNDTEFNRLKEVFKKDSLQLATFTITEKGYSVTDANGNILPSVKADLEGGADKPQSYIGKVAALLYERYKSGKKPIAMVSTDNCSHNGDKLHAAIECFAKGWCENGSVEKGFNDYINNRNKVSFPWTMIDKITPRPDASVEAMLKSDGVEDLEPVITSKNTYVASFVNAEETGYLVIEDSFPNGRPALEKGGVIFTDRETVDKVEKMKVCISGSNEYDYLEEVDNIIANLVTISDNELEFEIQAEKFIVPNPTFAFFCENKLGTVHYKPISDGLINRNEGEAIDNFSKKTLEGWSVLILELIRPLTPQKSFKGKIYTQEDTLKFKFLQQMVSETEVKNIPCYI